MISKGNGRTLRLCVLGLTAAYGVGMWFAGPRLWPTPRFALVVTTIVYMLVTLVRSSAHVSGPAGRTGGGVRALTDPRQFWRLHGSVLMMLGISELSIRSESYLPRTTVNDVLVALLLVTAATTMTLMARGVMADSAVPTQ